eukprot:731263-Pyramimonas_sp.AAC.1
MVADCPEGRIDPSRHRGAEIDIGTQSFRRETRTEPFDCDANWDPLGDDPRTFAIDPDDSRACAPLGCDFALS